MLYLCDLGAKEEAELIEKAFAADCVDVTIMGNWNMVKEELGVPGTGLVPEALANKGFARRSVYVDSDRPPSQRPGVGVGEPIRPIAASSAKAKKKKRKAEKAKRKRGRR